MNVLLFAMLPWTVSRSPELCAILCNFMATCNAFEVTVDLHCKIVEITGAVISPPIAENLPTLHLYIRQDYSLEKSEDAHRRAKLPLRVHSILILSVPHILAINNENEDPNHLYDISLDPAASPILPADLEALQLTQSR